MNEGSASKKRGWSGEVLTSQQKMSTAELLEGEKEKNAAGLEDSCVF